MENASNALLMAAGVLIGVMVITIGVVLFTTFSDYGHTTTEQLEQSKIIEWNNNFTKYQGNLSITIKEDGPEKEIVVPIPVTAHDIVTVANFAKQSNKNNELEESDYNENGNTLYVKVDISANTNTPKYKESDGRNFENKSDDVKHSFMKNYSLIEKENGTKETRYYKVTDIKISEATKRVYYIKFTEFTQGNYDDYNDIKNYNKE